MHSLKVAIKQGLIRSISPVSSTLYRERPKRRVISLHDIPERFQGAFREKMEWVREHTNPVSLDALYHLRDLHQDKLNVAITFDDAFKEQAIFAAPILRELNIPATFFTPSAAIGSDGSFKKNLLRKNGTFAFMTAEELKSLAYDPLFTIGGHTMHHPDLGKELSNEELEREIKEDKQRLEQIIEKPVHFFAYPFGGIVNMHPHSVEAIKNSGYIAAFSILPSYWSLDTNAFHVGRDCLALDDSDVFWDASLRGGYDAVSAIKNYFLHQL